MKLVTWLAKDSETLFGKFDPMSNTDTRTNVQIIAIGQFEPDASQYIGLSNEDVTPKECAEILNVPENTFYNIYSPINGYFLTDAWVESILKDLRQKELDNLTVKVEDHVYDADEVSQDRMARAYMIIGDTGTIDWKLADNKVFNVSGGEIKQALTLAGKAQTALWAKYTLN
jgi:hypothetical protein